LKLLVPKDCIETYDAVAISLIIHKGVPAWAKSM